MKLCSKIINEIKAVYQYEKRSRVDIGTLQNVMLIFVVVMLLIDIQNLKLGEYVIASITFVVAVVSIFAILALGHSDKIYRICMAAVIAFLILAVPISLYGSNKGFSMMWYFLVPIISIILLGMPFGIPVSVGFGLYVTAMFYTPLKELLIYDYPKYYLFYYPLFYWSFFVIVVVIDIFYKRYQMNQEENEKELEKDVAIALEDRKKLMIDAVTAISQMLDAKDGYTQQHSKRVAEYSLMIAKSMNKFSDKDYKIIYRSALLHDIGKIAVPDMILNKPGRLTDEEYNIMRKHTVWGGEILKDLEFLPDADKGAIYHHERIDGKGYPYGIKADELPELVRIISAADSLDAMSSNRCYRKQCDKQYIIDEFKKGAGRQFDNEVAHIVISLIERVNCCRKYRAILIKSKRGILYEYED